ncbi:MAG: ribonuclease R [Betaproteobacteria bacterium]|nr:ribonuclease R [Betaproteobacteria bacterium]
MKQRASERSERNRARGTRRRGSNVAESLLSELRTAAVPLQPRDLARRVGYGNPAHAEFQQALEDLEHEGSVMQNRRGALCLVDNLDLIRGRVQGHRDGYGFLVRDDGKPDCFVGARQMHKVLHGDRVMAREIGVDRRGRCEVAIVEVLDRGNATVVGRLRRDYGILVIEPEDRRISQPLLVAPDGAGEALPGQVVVAEIVAQPSRAAQPVARIVEVLGSYADPGMEIEIALRKHRLPYRFGPEAEDEAARFAPAPEARDLRGRKDLRSLALVTIDGENARDFDDAVWCEALSKGAGGASRAAGSGGFRLIVAIADVSHYVHHGAALDQEALERGNSVYFPRRVIPMLPEALSNGLCSLNPEVDRLCVACDMTIGARGRLESYAFYSAVIHSRARLTYTRVAAFLEGSREDLAPEVCANLDALARAYGALAQARSRRGAIDFETIETELVFNEERKIERIVKVQRNDAHRLIEECMLAANVCASSFLKRNRQPMLYRIHEGPTPEKLGAVREFLGDFGLQLGGGDEPKAGDYARLLGTIKDRPDAQLLQTVLLRSLQQAVYSPDNVGHFGLAYESYTHFTSPIRRYPDLLVHRAIKAVLAKKRYTPGDWAALGAHCSMTERRADEATRDVVNWLKCYYMRDRVGEHFEGSVSAATGFGIFVALDEVYVEGLVHVSELGNDYFHFDPARHLLLGSRTGRRFRLGDRVGVKLVRVDLEQMRIDFTLDE